MVDVDEVDEVDVVDVVDVADVLKRLFPELFVDRDADVNV